ncbi:MAG: DUF4249 domain-containing protein [Tannerella sp.]|jgi:hypothetical protein|nr:DUF4249 domain-containing protein [Tannerella sp.]
MNHKLIALLIYVTLSASCSVDYDPDIRADSECIVVNSYLQPDSMITVRLYANRLNGNRSEVIPLEGAHVVLEENGKTLYDGIAESVLRLDVYPKTGGNYSIRVRHADYPPVEAETSIPQPITCELSLDGLIYTVYNFQFPEKETPLWITCTVLFTDTIPPVQYGVLFTKNALVDNMNRSEGLEFMDVRVGAGYHEGFLRIKPANQPELTGIEFLPWLWTSMLWDGYLGDEVRLIAASREYDQYCKTLYQMSAGAVAGDGFNAVLYQPVHVYTNIKGGWGIFAGKSETFHFVKNVGSGNEDEAEFVLRSLKN